MSGVRGAWRGWRGSLRTNSTCRFSIGGTSRGTSTGYCLEVSTGLCIEFFESLIDKVMPLSSIYSFSRSRRNKRC